MYTNLLKNNCESISNKSIAILSAFLFNEDTN